MRTRVGRQNCMQSTETAEPHVRREGKLPVQLCGLAIDWLYLGFEHPVLCGKNQAKCSGEKIEGISYTSHKKK